MSNPNDQKPLPSQGASAPSVPGASDEPTRAATGDVRELPKEIEEALRFYVDAVICEATARGRDEGSSRRRRALVSAISGELARVEKERDDWRHASGQDHEARRVAEEALAPWTERALRAEHDADMQREYGHRAGDALAAERARHAAAESESARLREALALVFRHGHCCQDCHYVAKAALSSSPAAPDNSATKEE